MENIHFLPVTPNVPRAGGSAFGTLKQGARLACFTSFFRDDQPADFNWEKPGCYPWLSLVKTPPIMPCFAENAKVADQWSKKKMLYDHVNVLAVISPNSGFLAIRL